MGTAGGILPAGGGGSIDRDTRKRAVVRAGRQGFGRVSRRAVALATAILSKPSSQTADGGEVRGVLRAVSGGGKEGTGTPGNASASGGRPAKRRGVTPGTKGCSGFGLAEVTNEPVPRRPNMEEGDDSARALPNLVSDRAGRREGERALGGLPDRATAEAVSAQSGGSEGAGTPSPQADTVPDSDPSGGPSPSAEDGPETGAEGVSRRDWQLSVEGQPSLGTLSNVHAAVPAEPSSAMECEASGANLAVGVPVSAEGGNNLSGEGQSSGGPHTSDMGTNDDPALWGGPAEFEMAGDNLYNPTRPALPVLGPADLAYGREVTTDADLGPGVYPHGSHGDEPRGRQVIPDATPEARQPTRALRARRGSPGATPGVALRGRYVTPSAALRGIGPSSGGDGSPGSMLDEGRGLRYVTPGSTLREFDPSPIDLQFADARATLLGSSTSSTTDDEGDGSSPHDTPSFTEPAPEGSTPRRPDAQGGHTLPLDAQGGGGRRPTSLIAQGGGNSLLTSPNAKSGGDSRPTSLDAQVHGDSRGMVLDAQNGRGGLPTPDEALPAGGARLTLGDIGTSVGVHQLRPRVQVDAADAGDAHPQMPHGTATTRGIHVEGQVDGAPGDGLVDPTREGDDNHGGGTPVGPVNDALMGIHAGGTSDYRPKLSLDLTLDSNSSMGEPEAPPNLDPVAPRDEGAAATPNPLARPGNHGATADSEHMLLHGYEDAMAKSSPLGEPGVAGAIPALSPAARLPEQDPKLTLSYMVERPLLGGGPTPSPMALDPHPPGQAITATPSPWAGVVNSVPDTHSPGRVGRVTDPARPPHGSHGLPSPPISHNAVQQDCSRHEEMGVGGGNEVMPMRQPMTHDAQMVGTADVRLSAVRVTPHALRITPTQPPHWPGPTPPPSTSAAVGVSPSVRGNTGEAPVTARLDQAMLQPSAALVPGSPFRTPIFRMRDGPRDGLAFQARDTQHDAPREGLTPASPLQDIRRDAPRDGVTPPSLLQDTWRDAPRNGVMPASPLQDNPRDSVTLALRGGASPATSRPSGAETPQGAQPASSGGGHDGAGRAGHIPSQHSGAWAERASQQILDLSISPLDAVGPDGLHVGRSQGEAEGLHMFKPRERPPSQVGLLSAVLGMACCHWGYGVHCSVFASSP
jgi:hypothetical protein